ncbi:MAG: hypothetical protein CVV27_06060 [Candidatus Melainabacteria bacterium HGW-Melainabacteria-1]|nr:MAG: hypothetical protein CVV27_06060 [Candidatus Melainabacteria bacterium HGW-Melainabacteria-1]
MIHPQTVRPMGFALRAMLGAALAILALQPALAAIDPPVSVDFKHCGLSVRTDRARKLADWKPQIAEYSRRHYGESTWELDPQAIVLHYTVSSGFPWNLVTTKDFAGETPGLAVQYVVDGKQVWQILPANVRSRGAYGINHRAINIELVALHAADLAKRKDTLATGARLTWCLAEHYGLKDSQVFSHQDVSSMDTKRVPYVLDLLDNKPYHKIDPGEGNMLTIRAMIAKLRAGR